MQTLFRMRRLVQEVAAQFADIDDGCDALIDHVIPERAGGKFPAMDNRCPAHHGLPHAAYAACAMIERQCDVDAVARARIAGRNKGPQHDLQARIRDFRCLGQTGRAGRVDEEAIILAAQMRAQGL